MLSILSGYLTMSRAIARQRPERHSLLILSDTIITRMLTGLNEAHYAYFDLVRKRMRDRYDYLTKPAMDALLNEANGGNTDVLDDKIAFHERVAGVFPTPEILAVINPERLRLAHARRVPQIQDVETLRGFLSGYHGQRLILKPAASSYGFGVVAITPDALGAVDHLGVRLSFGKLFDLFLDLLRESGRGRPDMPAFRCFIVQHQLAPHPSLREVIPGPALGSFRITTYRNRAGKVSIPYAHAKIPRPDAAQDNFHGGGTGNVIRRMDPVTGLMSSAWGKRYAESVLIERLERDPATGEPYADFRVPAWDELCQIAIDGANAFPEFRTVGWDVALTTQGPVIIEGNGHYDPDCIQTTLDRGIKREIEALFRT